MFKNAPAGQARGVFVSSVFENPPYEKGLRQIFALEKAAANPENYA